MKGELTGSLIWAGVIGVLALGSTAAYRLGYVDHDTVVRLVTGITGLWMVWYGNRMPKTLVPVPACAGQARRVASWSLVLSGLAYAGLWAFAPIPVAVWAGTGAVLAGVAVTLGYCLSLRAKGKAA
ncbi:hypothetical protein [Azospirillum sp. B4]|uniref:hypothetical protein n=1 Tax=Azospirillum sp. B4 TaxID=95605 RepID=UPI00034A78EF|nr:hypothetical protein [Azospirillum sp. B4]